jgi:hypothetical protein
MLARAAQQLQWVILAESSWKTLKIQAIAVVVFLNFWGIS